MPTGASIDTTASGRGESDPLFGNIGLARVIPNRRRLRNWVGLHGEHARPRPEGFLENRILARELEPADVTDSGGAAHLLTR